MASNAVFGQTRGSIQIHFNETNLDWTWFNSAASQGGLFVVWMVYFYCVPHYHLKKRKDKKITFQSCKILCQSITNHSAVLWHMICFQNHRSVTQTGIPGSYFIVSVWSSLHKPPPLHWNCRAIFFLSQCQLRHLFPTFLTCVLPRKTHKAMSTCGTLSQVI